jgi:hypothetical protein
VPQEKHANRAKNRYGPSQPGVGGTKLTTTCKWSLQKLERPMLAQSELRVREAIPSNFQPSTLAPSPVAWGKMRCQCQLTVVSS